MNGENKDTLRVAFAGTEGAYASIAAKKMFPNVKPLSCPDFIDAYRGTETGHYDYAVLPIENSYAGEVGTVTDLMFSGSLHINRVISLPIRHALIVNPRAENNEIKTVVSHPQALMQCAVFIKENNCKVIESPSTSHAAKYVMESGRRDIAAIASEEAAQEFGLTVLQKEINDSSGNTTRFAAFSRTQNTDTDSENCNFSIIFTVENKAGALLEPLRIIAKHGYNMRCLRSRPLKNTVWCYYFYIEAEGNIGSENGRNMLSELSAVCAGLKLVGSFCVRHDKEAQA